MSPNENEMLGAMVERGPLGLRMLAFACAADRKGMPVGDLEKVGESPWYPPEFFDERARIWYFDLYRERAGFVHPEDPRGGSELPDGVSVFVADCGSPMLSPR